MGVIDTVRESLSTMTWWERTGALLGIPLFLAFSIASVAFTVVVAVVLVRETALFLFEHVNLPNLARALIGAAERLGAALVVIGSWFLAVRITKRPPSHWAYVLCLFFVVLVHLFETLISGQGPTLGKIALDVGVSLGMYFFVYFAFMSTSGLAEERLARRPIYTELSTGETALYCAKVCAVVAVVAFVFAAMEGSGSFDIDDPGYGNNGYEVTPDERFISGVTTFLFLVTPALTGVWWTFRRPLLDAWRGTPMALYRRVCDRLWILPESQREEFMADPALAERVRRAEADGTLDDEFLDRLNEEARRSSMNGRGK